MWIGIVVLLLIGVAVAIFPMLSHHVTPAWSEDGGRFLHDVDEALQKYSLEHKGKTPSALESLYPEYIRDKRVTEQISLFGERRMAIIYWFPSQLGDAGTVTAQLVLDPSIKSDYPWHSIVLWGDGHVRLHKLQPK